MDKKLLILQEIIDKAIKEVLSESNKKQEKLDVIIENVVGKQLRSLKEDDEKISNKKRSVIQWLKQPEIDAAEIRRKLEGEPESQEEEDSKRSYFMKKVNQTYGKDFSDEEVNGLYAIKSGLGE